jgi:hypothetical protein
MQWSDLRFVLDGRNLPSAPTVVRQPVPAVVLSTSDAILLIRVAKTGASEKETICPSLKPHYQLTTTFTPRFIIAWQQTLS